MSKYPPIIVPKTRTHDDYCSEDGAHRLGHMIREAWASVGVTVPCEVRRVVRSTQNNTRYDVWTVAMPTLVNGLPVDRRS